MKTLNNILRLGYYLGAMALTAVLVSIIGFAIQELFNVTF